MFYKLKEDIKCDVAGSTGYCYIYFESNSKDAKINFTKEARLKRIKSGLYESSGNLFVISDNNVAPMESWEVYINSKDGDIKKTGEIHYNWDSIFKACQNYNLGSKNFYYPKKADS